MSDIDAKVLGFYETMKTRDVRRDQEMRIVRIVREGRMRELFPDFMADALPGAIVANKIDTAARDLAEVIAPLPALRVTSGKMVTDTDRERATKKRRIAQNYWDESRLAVQMFNGADWYGEAGFLVGYVEADFDCQLPKIQIDSPFGAHYDVDRYGELIRYAKRYNDYASNLIARFADVPGINKLSSNKDGRPSQGDTIIELVRYMDRKRVVLFAPQYGLTLASYEHGLDECPAVLAVRPGDLQHPRGAYNDVVWTLLAKAIMAQYTLDAADKAVNAPIAMPDDADTLPIGKDAVIQTQGGAQSVGRVNLQVPQSAFAMMNDLDAEMSAGMRYPDLRTGVSNASVITGRGVQQMMGTFDTQIKTAQTILGWFLSKLTSRALKLDEVLWPGLRREIHGVEAGQPWELTYTPKTDINGLYECSVTYGFAAGSTPQAALVSLLQLRGDDIIDRSTFRENLPFDIDESQVQQNLDVQHGRDALMGGVTAITQAMGALVQAGQDPMPILALVSGVIKDRQNGKSIEDSLEKRLQAQQEQAQEAAAQQQAAAEAAGGGGALPGVMSNGLPEGVASGQAGMAPGGLPTVQNLTAGFRGGQAVSDSSIRRRFATGGK